MSPTLCVRWEVTPTSCCLPFLTVYKKNILMALVHSDLRCYTRCLGVTEEEETKPRFSITFLGEKVMKKIAANLRVPHIRPHDLACHRDGWI